MNKVFNDNVIIFCNNQINLIFVTYVFYLEGSVSVWEKIVKLFFDESD